MMDLISFAKTKAVKPTFLDKIKEKDEVLQGFKEGVPTATIRRWLITECGYPESMFPQESQFRNIVKACIERVAS